ncbi:putative ion channel POLLUX [Vitis vinifera]|uniref:Putative ion channel POLLUX n=1 Tax=Vitis vinifera TaxID=29760 RepID=A0A438CYA0_VITVI|nr:putative ion channel POLLUX [Vitis vinifera]
MPQIKIPNSNPKPNPNKYERPPVLKKSRTISDDVVPAPHFPGPLFPAVRRSSPSPPPPPPPPASSTAADVSGFSDRDWLFPSFLGPHTVRGRVPVQAAKSPKHDFSHSHSGSPNRSRSMPSGLGGGGHGEMVESMRLIGVLRSSTEVPESEKEAKPVAVRSSSSTGLSARRARGFKRSVYLYLLILTCIFSVSYAIYLRNEVTKLQGEITNLLILCNDKDDVHNHSYKVLKLGDDGFGGLALYAVSDGSLAEALWLSWTFVADSGNHADRVGTGQRIVSVSISSGGMLIFAMMLGLVSDAISEKVDSLRKGKSEVIERNHILILGWSDKLMYDCGNISSGFSCCKWVTFWSMKSCRKKKLSCPRNCLVMEMVSIAIYVPLASANRTLDVLETHGSLLKQLAIANKSIGGGCSGCTCRKDKEEMEMDIAKLEFDFMGTSVICRSGSPLILADLKKVSVSKARAIIVLASDENADQVLFNFHFTDSSESDARALRVVLSLTGVKEGLKGHVVVEMSDLDNEPLVKLVGGELIETVVAHDVIGRLMIQCALQPGLAQGRYYSAVNLASSSALRMFK